MHDQVVSDPAIMEDSPHSQPFQFGSGEDPIAAHKRLMKAATEGRLSDRSLRHAALVGSEMPIERQSSAAKVPKQFNAADYLLPSKTGSSSTPTPAYETSQTKTAASHSRFQRFFGGSQGDPGSTPRHNVSHFPDTPVDTDGRFGHVPDNLITTSAHTVTTSESNARSLATAPPGFGTLPPQDHASRLMGLLTSKVSVFVISRVSSAVDLTHSGCRSSHHSPFAIRRPPDSVIVAACRCHIQPPAIRLSTARRGLGASPVWDVRLA